MSVNFADWGLPGDLVREAHSTYEVPDGTTRIEPEAFNAILAKYQEGHAQTEPWKLPSIPASNYDRPVHELLAEGARLSGIACALQIARASCLAGRYFVHAFLRLSQEGRRAMYKSAAGADEYVFLVRNLAGALGEASVVRTLQTAGEKPLEPTIDEDATLGVDIILPKTATREGMCVQVKSTPRLSETLFVAADDPAIDRTGDTGMVLDHLVAKAADFNDSWGVSYRPILALVGSDSNARYFFNEWQNAKRFKAFLETLAPLPAPP